MIMPDGKIDIVNLHESFNEDHEIHMTILHMIKKCLYPKGANGCEVAYDMFRCWKMSDPRVIFIDLYKKFLSVLVLVFGYRTFLRSFIR